MLSTRLFDGGDRLVHHCLLFGVKSELEDLLDAVGAENARNADVVALSRRTHRSGKQQVGQDALLNP